MSTEFDAPSTAEMMDLDTDFLGDFDVDRAETSLISDPEPDQTGKDPEHEGSQSTSAPDTEVSATTSAAGAADTDETAHRHEHDETPASLQHTETRDQIQAATTPRRRRSASDDETLPLTALKLAGVTSQPIVKMMPESITGALREQVRAAAVRELEVSDDEARQYSQRLSQTVLATGFLIAHLDLRVEADPATTLVAELFRSRDPLLGAIHQRLESLEHHAAGQQKEFSKLRGEVRAVDETVGVVEQLAVYTAADRELNFLRHQHDVHQAPFTHRETIRVRDRARRLVKDQRQSDQDKEGR